MFDGGVHKNPAHPTLKRTLVPKLVQVAKNFDKAFLQQVLGIVAIACITKANGIHFTGKLAVQGLLHTRVASKRSFD